MVKEYKDLIRILKQDGEDRKINFTAYAVLKSYYDELFSDYNSLDMRRHYKDLISGVLLGLYFTDYINEKVFHLLNDEVIRLVFN